MRKIHLLSTLIFLLISFSNLTVYAQFTGGIVYSDTNNLLVIKVQGNHYQRGFAQGKLLANNITDIIKNYAKPQFGSASAYNQLRAIVAAGSLFDIDSLFIVEAKAVIDGMNWVNGNPENLDYIDILVANSLLDIKSIMQAKGGMECSSLMSWGDATSTSNLGGKSVITRHLDWTVDPVLVRNQVMVIHIPSELDEQAWAGIGFAGMISVLSGFNSNLGVFQHMMSDDTHHGTTSGHYEPIWFTLRKSIEKKDPNQDGVNNVNDVKYYINQQSQGFSDGFIISALAKSTQTHDSLIAMVAELASVSPKITYRSNSFADSIPGDNLYTANNQIARNNNMNFCSRYNGIKNHIGNGIGFSIDDNRNLMKNYSHLASNYQFMTFVPEMSLFRISIRDNSAAYLSPNIDFNINNLFSVILSIDNRHINAKTIHLYPNPSKTYIQFDNFDTLYSYNIFDVNGKLVLTGKMKTNRINISELSKGVYTIKLFKEKQEVYREKILKQ